MAVCPVCKRGRLDPHCKGRDCGWRDCAAKHCRARLDLRRRVVVVHGQRRPLPTTQPEEG